jgi:hypothetical protein
MKSHKSPLETIRAFCVSCVGGHSKEVISCDGDGKIPGFMSCPFHPFRLGRGRPSVKIMRKFCLQCQGDSYLFVTECGTENCLIHPYRFGKNPARTGKGASQEQMLELSQKRMAMSR